MYVYSKTWIRLYSLYKVSMAENTHEFEGLSRCMSRRAHIFGRGGCSNSMWSASKGSGQDSGLSRIMILQAREPLHLPPTPALTNGNFSFPLHNDQLLFTELFQTVLSILHTASHLLHNTPRRKVLQQVNHSLLLRMLEGRYYSYSHKEGNQGTKAFSNLLKITWPVSSRAGSEPFFLATMSSQHHSNVVERCRLKPLWPD